MELGNLGVYNFLPEKQVCELKFGSWTYDASKIELWNVTAEEDISDFTPNGEWTLESIPVQRNVDLYQCCPDPYITIDFLITIKRKPLYYVINLIAPCTFITATAILVFCLPPDSGEKISLAVTVLLASTVFLLLVAEAMPPQSEVVPLIGEQRKFIVISTRYLRILFYCAFKVHLLFVFFCFFLLFCCYVVIIVPN